MEELELTRFERFVDGVKSALQFIIALTIVVGWDVIYEVCFQKVWGSPTISLRGFVVDKLGLAELVPEFSDTTKTIFFVIAGIEIALYIGIKIYEFIKNRKNR